MLILTIIIKILLVFSDNIYSFKWSKTSFYKTTFRPQPTMVSKFPLNFYDPQLFKTGVFTQYLYNCSLTDLDICCLELSKRLKTYKLHFFPYKFSLKGNLNFSPAFFSFKIKTKIKSDWMKNNHLKKLFYSLNFLFQSTMENKLITRCFATQQTR